MEVTVNLPEDVVKAFSTDGADVEREILEATALEGYRDGKLSHGQVRRILGFSTEMEVDEFLKLHGVCLNYSLEDLEQDRRTLDGLFRK